MLTDIQRGALRYVLSSFAEQHKRTGLMPFAEFRNLANALYQVIPDADLCVSTDHLGFTGVDGYRYCASSFGLWRLSDKMERVDVDVWWVAVLNVHEYCVRWNKRFDAMKHQLLDWISDPLVGGVGVELNEYKNWKK